MTLHIGRKDYSCPYCDAVFVPFGVPPICPNCARENPVSQEYHDSISWCVSSLRYNRSRYGRYRPGAWSIITCSDRIQYYLFIMCDFIETDRPADVQKYVEHEWQFAPWEPYVYRHMLDIFLQTYFLLVRPPENSREYVMKLFGRWHSDKLMPLSPTVPIRIPNQHAAWYGETVVVARGVDRTISVFKGTYEKMRESMLSATGKMVGEESRDGFTDFLLMGAHESTISSAGELAVPRHFMSHIGYGFDLAVKDAAHGLEVYRSGSSESA